MNDMKWIICNLLQWKKIINSYNRTATKQNSSYVMKVDDDTFVSVNLLNMLTEVQREEDQVWWSLFHHRRSVPAYGKWADFTYPSLTYPAFPAGSGYVMTSKLNLILVKLH